MTRPARGLACRGGPSVSSRPRPRGGSIPALANRSRLWSGRSLSSVVARWPGLQASARTRCKGSFGSGDGRCASIRSACSLASRPCCQSRPRRTGAGSPICAGSGRASLSLAIDRHTGELLGCHLSRSGKAKTAASALEYALVSRFGALGKVTRVPAEVRQGPDLHKQEYTSQVRSCGLRQNFITPYCPQQNGLEERVIRMPKEQCIHRQHFDSIQHAMCTIDDWISFLNHHRPDQAPDMPPTEAFAFTCADQAGASHKFDGKCWNACRHIQFLLRLTCSPMLKEKLVVALGGCFRSRKQSLTQR